MRALITFIAILTVGIVTAQINQFDVNSNELRGVAPLGLPRANYVTVGDLRDDLRNFYPAGTSSAFQFRQDEIGLDFDIEEIHISHTGTFGQNDRGVYRIRFNLNGGAHVDFNGVVPDENILTDNNVEVTLNSNRNDNGNYRPANQEGNAYRAEVTLIFTKPGGQLSLYVTATIIHPIYAPNTVARRVTYGFRVGDITTNPTTTLRQDVTNRYRVRPFIGGDGLVNGRADENGRFPNATVVKQDGNNPVIDVAQGVDVFLDYTFNHIR